MNILRVFLLIIEVVCALLLIGVILLQKSRSEGMGLAFGSGMGESLFGSRAGNVLTRITIILGAVFLLNTLGLAKLYSGTQGTVMAQSLVTESEAQLPPSQPIGLHPESSAAATSRAVESPVAPVTPSAPEASVTEDKVPEAPGVKADETPATE